MSQFWLNSNSSGGATIDTITGNSGGAVGPDGSNNINIIGAGNITVSGNAGTNTETVTLIGTTNHALQVGNVSGSLTSLGVSTNGQLPIGSVGSNPVLATLTAGNGIAITNGAGSITIAAIGEGIVWTDEAISFAAVVSNGYFITANATATLPAAPSQGDVVAFNVVSGSTTLTIQANTGQKIQFGNTASSTAGTLANTKQGDAVTLFFRAASSTWQSQNGIGGWDTT